ncbi:hypothetical protein COB21_02580 [Candidatus Aerophobetes bacterium]|uniref:Uncharacterized protein n=1 Tax=Aerophobetes bacterium TaxID=2030807 RepID=A0A2A4X5J1_UNCAE|nr:MAG: hypothetical protein COB21_02580 [Candidatus Aerophobetes bacterium]
MSKGIKRLSISLCVVFGLFFSLIVFQDQLIPLVIKRFINNRAPGIKLEDFSFEKCKWGKDRFVLTGVNFNVMAPGIQGNVKASSCSLFFSYKGAAKVYFSIEDPQLDIAVSPSLEGDKVDVYNVINRMFFSPLPIEIRRGHAQCYLAKQGYSFDFSMPLGKEKLVEISHLSLRSTASKPSVDVGGESSLSIMMRKQKDLKQIAIHVDIASLNMQLLNDMAPHVFDNQMFKEIEVAGWLKGFIELKAFYKQSPRIAKLDLSLKEATIKDKNSGSLAYVKKGVCKLEGFKEKGRDLEEETALALVPYLGFLKNYRAFELEIDQGYLGSEMGPGGKLVALKDIEIKTDYEDAYLNHYHFKANLYCGGKVRPLLVMGSESKSKSNFYRQSIEEESSLDRWQCIFSFNHQNTKRSLDYSLEIPQASNEEMVALLKLKKIFFRDSEDISLGGGNLKAYIRGELSDHHHYLRVHYLDVENILFAKDLISFSAHKASLRCNLDLKKKQFYRHSSWDLHVEEGAFKKGSSHFEGVHFEGGMNDTYVKPSKLTFYWLDKKTDCLFEGLLSHLNADIETSFLPLEIKRFLSSSICLESKQPMAALEVKTHLSFGLDATFSQIRTEGVCKLSVGEGKSQEVEFGLNFSAEEAYKSFGIVPSYAFLMGWFKAEHLEADALNLAFYLMNKDWQCEGSVGVEGSINSKVAQISMDPTNLVFCSDMAKLYPQKEGGVKAPRLNFTLDYHTNIWTGNLPLDKVVFELPTFGLVFTPFSSKLDLQDNLFTFHDIKASYEGLEFCGEMTLDFFKPDLGKIKLSCDKARGSTHDLQSFLRHFDDFENIEIYGTGAVELGSHGTIDLEAVIGKEKKLLALDIKARLLDYSLPLSSSCYLDQFTASIEYNFDKGELAIFNGEGRVEGEEILARGKNWRAKLDKLTFDTKKEEGFCKALISSPTYDLIAFNSRFEKRKEGLFMECDQKSSRFFGSTVDKLTLLISNEKKLQAFDVEGEMSGLSLYGFLELMTIMEWVPLPSKLLSSIQSPRFNGLLSYMILVKDEYSHVDLEVKGKDIRVGKVGIPKVNISMTKRGSKVNIADFEIGDFSLEGGGELKNKRLMTDSLDISFKDSFCHVAEGSFIEEGRISFKNSFFALHSADTTFPFLSKYSAFKHIGKIKGDGNIEIVFSQDLDAVRCFGKMGLSLLDCFEEGIFIDWIKPFSFEVDTLGKVNIRDAECQMKTSSDSNVWIKANLKEGVFNLIDDDSNHLLKGLHLVVPPEATHFLAEKQIFPFIKAKGKGLSISGVDFLWENQIDALADISFGKKVSVEASIKEGYYWLGKESWFVDGSKISIEGKTLRGCLGLQKDAIDWKLKFKGNWEKELFGAVEIIEAGQPDQKPLNIAISSNESEGIFIQSVEGDVFGLSMSFRHNPKDSVLDRMVLTGGMRINGYSLSDFLPEVAASVIEKFEIGRGYELSGDVVLYKTVNALKDSYFSGFFKGKHMEFYGREIETLMSEVIISPHMIEFSNCCISDASGLFEIPEIKIERTPSERWKVRMDKLHIQDFRPSLIKKIGVYRGRIKPLVIRDFNMEGIEGYLDNLLSFKGDGHFSFINTFKRDTHILDIPLEILGRLGLDMGLLIPVKGGVQFVLEDGIVHFVDLKNSYSYGDRSEFFLSKKELSYIDLNGNIDVHIKMKQHVLLKITQPFTLSILGNISKPKYSLH